MELLLSNKADPNMQGDLSAQRPLQTAVDLKKKSAIELLLRYGADPELATGLCPSPLDMAVKSDDMEIYMMFLAISKYERRLILGSLFVFFFSSRNWFGENSSFLQNNAEGSRF